MDEIVRHVTAVRPAWRPGAARRLERLPGATLIALGLDLAAATR
jgi:hypothetical protein